MSHESHVDELIGVYLLGALSAEERRTVADHLRQCARCRALVQESRDAAHALGRGAEPISPEPHVKRNLMQRINADLRQMPASAPPPMVENWFARATRVWSPAFALASLILVAILGVWNLSLLNAQTGLNAELDFFTQPRLRTASLTSTAVAPGGAQATVFVPAEGSTALLVVNGLKPLGPDQIFEFWLIRQGQSPVPAGIFNVNTDGAGRLWVQAPESLNRYNQAGLTIERAGGSSTPNMDALVFLGVLN